MFKCQLATTDLQEIDGATIVTHQLNDDVVNKIKNARQESPDSDEWPLVQTLTVLGTRCSYDNSLRDDWKHTKACMWGAFWGNFKKKRRRVRVHYT